MKKLILKSMMVSAILHLIYFVSILVIGFVQTWNYTPELSNGTPLSNEVAFGFTVSPILFVLSFVVLSVLVGGLLVTYRKVFTDHA